MAMLVPEHGPLGLTCLFLPIGKAMKIEREFIWAKQGVPKITPRAKLVKVCKSQWHLLPSPMNLIGPFAWDMIISESWIPLPPNISLDYVSIDD